MSQLDRLTRGHKSSALVAHDLGDTPDICGDDRTATSERLKDNVGAAFHVTWQGDQIRCRHPDGDIVEGTLGQRVDVVGRIVGLNGAFDQWPVRPLADHIHMQVRAKKTQRSRRLDQFTQAFFHVHAPDVNHGLRGRVDVQLLPRLKTISDMEDGEIATAEDGAGRR